MTTLSNNTYNALVYALGPGGNASAAEIDGILAGNDITLADTNILVGNSTGKAAAVAVSGDATLADTGALTIASGKLVGAGLVNLPGNATGNTTVLAAAGRARTCIIVVTPSANFANGNGAQPTFTLGQGSNNNSIAVTGDFTGANTNQNFTFATTLGANNALVAACAAAATGNATGGINVTAIAVG